MIKRFIKKKKLYICNKSFANSKAKKIITLIKRFINFFLICILFHTDGNDLLTALQRKLSNYLFINQKNLTIHLRGNISYFVCRHSLQAMSAACC